MNMLNTSLSTIAITAALTTPFAAQADSYSAAVDSCINAFVSSSLPKGQPVKIKKDDDLLSLHEASAFKIVVSAKGAESGKYIAHGTCIVDRSGAVLQVNFEPFTQQQLALR